MRPLALLLLAAIPLATPAQWTILDTHTTADLRGVSAPTPGVVWISGTNGTVLRSEDAGYLWQHCTTPPNAEHLDFRGIQAFDANTAIIMSSGKGDLSRLYKTTDGCQTWKLVFTNPDPEGFWDALRITQDKTAYVLGDPVGGKFAMYFTEDDGDTWFTAGEPGRDAAAGAGAFAASNSSLISISPFMLFGAGAGKDSPPSVYRTQAKCLPPPNNPKGFPNHCTLEWIGTAVPLGSGSLSSGVFSLAARMTHSKDGNTNLTVVAVGGTYDQPDINTATSANSTDGGKTWLPATTPPHGYRSAVAYSAPTHTWITVGPNGTDISTDDGRNWRPLHPTAPEPPDADQHWNALALPYVVGPHGRVGILNPAALKPTKP